MSVESTILASITLSAPEMILAVGALFLLMVGVFAGEKSSEPVSWLAVLVLIFAGGWILFNPGEGQAYAGAFLGGALAAEAVEGLEQLAELVGRHAQAGVGDGDLHHVVRPQPAGDVHAPAVGVVLHRVA